MLCYAAQPLGHLVNETFLIRYRVIIIIKSILFYVTYNRLFAYWVENM